MTTIFNEVQFIDGIQEFLESSFITQLYPKDNNSLPLSNIAAPDTITFSGDVSLFKKQVYDVNDLTIEGAWLLNNPGTINNSIIINPLLKTSKFTYTYITYATQSTRPQEGLFSVDYKNGILYTSTGIKSATINYRHSIQYAEGQRMDQLPASTYTRATLYSLPIEDNSKISAIYQLPMSSSLLMSKEFIQGGVLSLVTTGDSSA